MQPVGISHTDSSFFYQPSDPPSSISWEKQDEFLFRIESGEGEVVREMVEETVFLLSYTHSLYTLGCEMPLRTADVSLSYGFKLLSEKTDDSWKASPNMQAIVNTLFSSDEVKAYYMQFFLNITSLLKKQSVYNTGELIDQIQFYIQRNYQKNITQEFIASLFYLNRSYLSQLSKSRPDKNLSTI